MPPCRLFLHHARSFVTLPAAALLASLATAQTLPVQLVANGDFENGTTSWIAVHGTTATVAYGTAGWPSFAVASAAGGINGGTSFLRDVSSNARVVQHADVSAYAALFDGSTSLEISGAFGGGNYDNDRSRLNVRFLSGGVGSPQIGSTVQVGDIDNSERNGEIVLVNRSSTVVVPAGTQTIDVEIEFLYASSSAGVNGVIDNVSARLVPTATTPAVPLGQELIVNGGFENGWTPTSPLTLANPRGWEPESQFGSLSAAEAYGAPLGSGFWPSTAVAAPVANGGIDGGSRFLRDTSQNARLIQHVDVSGNTSSFNGALSLEISGAFGGGNFDNDRSRLNVRFLSGGVGSPQIGSTVQVGDIDNSERNGEIVLVNRSSTVVVPAGTQTIDVEIEFLYVSNSAGVNGVIDNVSARLVPTATTRAYLPWEEMIVNGGFENGWTPTSPLTLANPRGWEPESQFGSLSAAEAYGAPLGSGFWPSTAVAAPVANGGIDGGSRFLRDTSGDARLIQHVDVSGNTTSFNGAVSLEISGAFGGGNFDNDRSRLNVRFLSGGVGSPQIGSTVQVGDIDNSERNGEIVLVNRSTTVVVPAGTQTIDVEIEFLYVSNSAGVNGVIDNVSAKLVPTPTTPAVPLGQELIVNGGFENGWTPTSPLTLADPRGWIGGRATAESYSSTYTPPIGSNGGVHLLKDSGTNAVFRQTIDLSRIPSVGAGSAGAYLSASLGGYGIDPDRAEVRLWGYDLSGASTGTAGSWLGRVGPVTNTDRGNQTIVLPRNAVLSIPPNTATLEVEIVFTYASNANGGPNGLVDDVSLVLFDTTQGGAAPFPGTASIPAAACYGGVADDFHMWSGLNGAQPTRGPGYDIKHCAGGDIVTLRLDCLSGRFDYSPVLLAANVFQDTNPQLPLYGPPPEFGGNIHLGISGTVPMLTLVDGFSYSGTFGGQLVFPTGANYSFFLPLLPSGTKVRLQAICLPFAAPFGTPALPCNTVYAATDAHELRF